ncbi:protein pxr1-like [Limosa lapponica baueri]|uniref:Protein pxr1-like n=1 Tax=Limosa lapponica baueri TaxID=1758121 RepID=A0A2I0TMU9_LIMLA|nr:protein pxr1-like [Limosa lapponica baueri]
MPEGSQMDPPLAKAQPIINGGSTSGITYLRRGEKTPCKSSSSEKRGLSKCEKYNRSADTKVGEEGGGGEAAPGTGAEIPLQPVVKTMVRQVVHLQSVEVKGGADVPLQPTEVKG